MLIICSYYNTERANIIKHDRLHHIDSISSIHLNYSDAIELDGVSCKDPCGDFDSEGDVTHGVVNIMMIAVTSVMNTVVRAIINDHDEAERNGVILPVCVSANTQWNSLTLREMQWIS